MEAQESERYCTVAAFVPDRSDRAWWVVTVGPFARLSKRNGNFRQVLRI